MGCKNCGVAKSGPDGRDHIIIDFADDSRVYKKGEKCPIDGSALKHAQRPRPHLRCARGHRYPSYL